MARLNKTAVPDPAQFSEAAGYFPLLPVETEEIPVEFGEVIVVDHESKFYTKIQTDALLEGKVNVEEGKGLSTEDFTTERKDKLDNLSSTLNEDVEALQSGLQNEAETRAGQISQLEDEVAGTGHQLALRLNQTTFVLAADLKDKAGNVISTVTADFPLENYYIKPNTGIPASDLSQGVQEILNNAPTKASTGNALDVSIDDDYKLSITLQNEFGDTLSSGMVDLPLEELIVDGEYDAINKKVVLTLQNENTIEFGIGDLIDGLINQSTFDSHTNNTDIHITAAERLLWNQVSNKVDQISGKQLSTEDYTTAEKNKLATIEEGANYIEVDSYLDAESLNPVQNKKITSALGNIGLSLERLSQQITGLPELISRKYTKPANGIPIGDLSDSVQNLLINKLNIHNGTGIYSLVQGENNFTQADYAVTFGYVNRNFGLQSFVEGAENINGARFDEITHNIIVDTTGYKGQASHIEGWANENHAYATHLEGCHNIVGMEGEYSHVEGDNNRLEAYAGHVEGCANKIFRHARQTHVEGYQNEGYGFETHVEGWNNKGGPYSATDYDETVTYQIGDTVKYLTTAGYIRYYACVQACTGQTPEDNLTYWQMTRAQHAEGIGTEAVGNGAHSQGGYTKAKYDYSMAGGYYTITGRDIQTVLGKYNAEDTEALFVIGDGIANNQRSNAFVVGNDGANPYIKIGDVKLTNTDLTILKGLADTKVDKVDGMGLSSNDFNATYQEKLESIAYGATQVYVDTELGNSTTHAIANKTVKDAINTLNTRINQIDVPLERGTPNNSVIMPNCTATLQNEAVLGTYNLEYENLSGETIKPAYKKVRNEAWDYSGNTLHIATVEDLLQFIYLADTTTNFAGKTIYLDCDLDVNPGWDATVTINESNHKLNYPNKPATEWTNVGTTVTTSPYRDPRQEFAGTFDGQGHTISGIYSYRDVKDEANHFGLLFNKVNGGSVKNLAVTNSFIYWTSTANNSESAYGGLMGGLKGNGTVENIYTDLTVVMAAGSGKKNSLAFGGITGWIGGSTVFQNSVFAGSILTANAYQGGTYPATNVTWVIGGVAGEQEGGTTSNLLGVPRTVLVSVPSVDIQAVDQKNANNPTGGYNAVIAGHYDGDYGTRGVNVLASPQAEAPADSDWEYQTTLESYVPGYIANILLNIWEYNSLFHYGDGTNQQKHDALCVGIRKQKNSEEIPEYFLKVGDTLITESQLQKLLALLN